MLTIKINSENKEEIKKYLNEANKTTFENMYTLLSEIGEGILVIEDNNDFITVDLSKVSKKTPFLNRR